jgi:hypothetical protein
MSGVTRQQNIATNDGTALVIESWLAEEGQVVMSPGESQFTATCPEHGEISSGYLGVLVGFEVGDHADDRHGGLAQPTDLMEVSPYIQM